MRITRCPVDLPLHPGQELDLPDDIANHLVRVMRLASGDGCILFNGDGHDYRAQLVQVGKRNARVCIQAAIAVDNESPLRIKIVSQSGGRGAVC